MNSFWRARTFIRNLTEVFFVWFACFSWPAPCSSVFVSVSFLSLFVSVSVLSTSLFPWSKLFPWTTEGSWEVDDIFSTSSTSACTEFTHSAFAEAFFLEEKLIIFEFKLNLWELLSLSRPLWVFVVPYVLAFLLWEQLVDYQVIPSVWK